MSVIVTVTWTLLLKYNQKFCCLWQVHLAENLPQATHTQNRVKTKSKHQTNHAGGGKMLSMSNLQSTILLCFDFFKLVELLSDTVC